MTSSSLDGRRNSWRAASLFALIGAACALGGAFAAGGASGGSLGVVQTTTEPPITTTTPSEPAPEPEPEPDPAPPPQPPNNNTAPAPSSTAPTSLSQPTESSTAVREPTGSAQGADRRREQNQKAPAKKEATSPRPGKLQLLASLEPTLTAGERRPRLREAVSNYAATIASRSGLYVSLLAAFGIAVAILLLASAPPRARVAFAERLAVDRNELLFLGAVSLVGAGIAFTTILLIG